MEIALILEGSYPYTTGGLSTWTNQLISSLEDHKFKIISIMPSRDKLLEHKYPLPSNVIEMQTLFLEDFLRLSPIKKKKSPKLSSEELNAIEQFLAFAQNVNWERATKTLADKQKIGNAVEFLKSETIWTYLLRVYEQDFAEQDFNRFFWAMISMYVPLINMLQQEGLQADIYHALSTGYAGLIGLVHKLKFNKPLMLTEHGIYAREREEEIINACWLEGGFKKMWIQFFYFISTGVYQYADLIISLFQKSRSIQMELGASSSKTLIIPNGVDPDLFNFSCETKKGVNIGAVLRIVPIKDIKTLIRAFKIVQDQLPYAKLFIIGSGEEDFAYYLECRQLVELLNLSDKIRFTGQVDIKEHLDYMDVLVLTSISEGQPLVMLEGMASGIPFVATDVGSCRELLEGFPDDQIGPAGIVTQPVSPEETAKAIITLLTNRESRRQMGLNARKRIEKYYTQEQFIDNYREAYASVYCKNLARD